MTMRRVCAAILLALACLAAFPASGALAQGPKADCKHGGYANYLDPATGEAFTNQGKCVRFVAKGGTLEPVPVEYPVTIAGVTTTGNAGPLGDPGGHSLCSGTRLSLFGYGTHTVVLSAEGIPGYVGGFTNTYPNQFFADGFWSAALGNTVNDWPITVTVDGQEIGTATPDCGPIPTDDPSTIS